MAFSCSRDSIGKKWDAIPKDIDILITHLPPKNIFDLTEDGIFNQNMDNNNTNDITSQTKDQFVFLSLKVIGVTVI
jgi:hypothetical protein